MSFDGDFSRGSDPCYICLGEMHGMHGWWGKITVRFRKWGDVINKPTAYDKEDLYAICPDCKKTIELLSERSKQPTKE